MKHPTQKRVISRLVVSLLNFALLLSYPLLAETEENPLRIPDLKNLRKKNDINPADYDQFWNRWQLITTRFRKDNGEQRFIYANDIAIKAMKTGDDEFPDGSVFGKVAFLSEDDPQFPNSAEPENFTRLQLMVKDETKYKETGGWGYWLHVDGAKDAQSSQQDRTDAMACHACHRIVADRDFIFATPTFIVDTVDWFGQDGDRFQSRFSTRKAETISPLEKEIIAYTVTKPKEIKSHRMRLFSGSLHESIGPLSDFAKDGSVYALVDPMHRRFLAAEQLKPSKRCRSRVNILMSHKKKSAKSSSRRVKRGIVCNGVNKWVGILK